MTDIHERFADMTLSDLKQYPNCYPDKNPLDIYRSHLTTLLVDITGVEAAIVFQSLQTANTLDKGDLVLPVPALRVKGKKPNEYAQEIIDKFPTSHLVEKPTQDGPYVTFFFKPDKLKELVIPTILNSRKSFGSNQVFGLKDQNDPSKGKKRMLVEFSSPNIAKPFHAGHLRSTIIGGFISNLHEFLGYDVVRINYLGDWGKQYGLLALGYKLYGSEVELKEDPINHLFKVYVAINNDLAVEKDQMKALIEEGKKEEAQKIADEGLDEQARRFFKAMTEGDEAAIAQWKRFRDLSIDRYIKTYSRLNIHFDDYSGESQVSEAGMEESARIMESKGVSEISQGAVIVDFSKLIPGKAGKQLEKPVIKKKDGTALYLTRDITEMQQRQTKYNFDSMIYVVASQQDLHLKQFFKIVELMGFEELSKKCTHINFGMVLGMSTRKGTVKFLDDILKDVGDFMHEVMQKNEAKYAQIENPAAVADILGITAVMIQDMSGKRINNYKFDMAVMCSFEGDTGPYLQYAHARLCSIFRKVGLSESELATADLSLLTEDAAIKLVRTLILFPTVVQHTLKTLEPATIVTYLFKLTHVVSSSYNELQVAGSEPELLKARLALYQAARAVIYNGMRLLGLSPVERM